MNIEMRVEVKLAAKEIQKIPINYNYFLSGVIYRKIGIGDEDLASELHKSRSFKFFTFSRILAEERRIEGDTMLIKNARFLLSSPREEIVKAFIEGILSEPAVKVASARFEVMSVEVKEKPALSSPQAFKTLSPIVVRTVREQFGKMRTWELYPKDGDFYTHLKANLLKKYETFYGKEAEDLFEIVKIYAVKPVRIDLKGIKHRASLMHFCVEASRELLNFAYDAGLGEKNAMGFGMVETAPHAANK